MSNPIPKHILVLPSDLFCPPHPPLSGIFQRHQVELLASKGLKVGVVSFGWISWRRLFFPFPYVREESWGSVKILRHFVRPLLPPRVRGRFLKRCLLRGYRDLVDTYIARYGRPDVIHAHNAFYAGLAACRIGVARDIPFILTEHNSAVMGEVAGGDLEDFQEVLAGARVLSAVGSSLAHRLDGLRPSGVSTPCSVLGNLLDPLIERASTMVGRVGGGRCSRPGFSFLAIGGLIPVKNHFLLLQAFARAFGQDSAVQLRIGGTGPLKGRLQAEARRLGVAARVIFLGYLDRAQVVDELATCDVLVSTSRTETFGVVLIEALAFGKPVVSTRSGGPEDFIGQGQGILTDQDVESVASALRRVRDTSFDPQAIQAHCIQQFGDEAFFNRLMDLYASAFAASRAIKSPLNKFEP